MVVVSQVKHLMLKLIGIIKLGVYKDLIPNNKLYKLILEKLEDIQVTGYHDSMYYMKRIAEHYGASYSTCVCSNKYLKDFAEAITGESYLENLPNKIYLHDIAEELGSLLEEDTENYYLMEIYELIDATQKTLTTLTINVPLNIVYSDEFNITGTLIDEDNNPVTSASVNLLVGNTIVETNTTNNQGEVSFTRTPVHTGNHSFQLTYNGDITYKTSRSSIVERVIGKETSVLTLINPIDQSNHIVNTSVTISGTLLDNENTGLSNKQVKIYVNNVLVDTVTTLNTGGFSKTVTAETSGNMTIRAVFDGDEEYYSSTEGVTVHVNKKPVTITFTSNKVSYVLGETITLSGTLKQGITNIGSASIEIYDGETLLDTVTTLSDGTFSKTITAGTVESKSFHAVYNGDATYESATSSNVNVTITKRTPTISLLTSKSSVSTGDSYTLSGALLYNGTGVANASVKLYQGQSVIDTLTTANDGTFSKTITSTAEGTFTYHVVFDATTTYTGVTSGNVTVTVSDVSFDAIELTSDKDILSAYDEESATLTAQLMSGTTPVAIAGETVTFEVRKTGDDSLVETLTADTNSSGVATVSYLGKGVGDLNIKAECMLVFKICSLKDLGYYNDGTKLSDLTIGSGVSCTVSDGALRISKSTSGEASVTLPVQFTNSDNFIIEWEVACNGTSQRTAFWLNTPSSSTGLWCCYEGGHFTGNSIGGSIPTTTTSLEVGDKIYLKQENGVITLLKNDEAFFSKSMSFSSSTYKFGYYTNSGRVQCVDNIKITQL